MWRIPIAFESFSLSTGIRMHSWLLIMRKVVCWQHFLSFVNKFHERVFQGPRSIRHVNLKTGSDSVTLANSKICWYDRPHVSEFAVYSKICTLKTVFENFRIRLPNSADRWARKPYWGKKDVDTKISECVDRAYKVTTVFFISFLKVVLKCFFFTKMRTPTSNKRLRCTKTTTTTTTTTKRHSGMALFVVSLEGQAPNAILPHVI